jgi:hypothetical protein
MPLPKDPYFGCPDARRLVTTINQSDASFLIGLSPKKGCIQTTLNILIKTLVNELHRLGYKDYTDESKFHTFLGDLHIGSPSARGQLTAAVVGTAQPDAAIPAVPDVVHVQSDSDGDFYVCQSSVIANPLSSNVPPTPVPCTQTTLGDVRRRTSSKGKPSPDNATLPAVTPSRDVSRRPKRKTK